MPRPVRVVMVGYQYRESLYRAVKRVKEVTGGKLSFTFFSPYEVDSCIVKPERYVEELKNADIVLLDIRGGDRVSKLTVDTLRNAKDKVVVTLVGGSPELIGLTRLGSFSLAKFMSLKEKPILKHFLAKKKGGLDYGTVLKMREKFEKLGRKIPLGIFRHAKNYALTLKYYDFPCEKNYTAMLLLLLKEYGGVKIEVDIPSPVTMPSMAIQDLDTGKTFESLSEYMETLGWGDEKPIVGVFFYGGYHYDQSIVAAKELAKALKRMGVKVLPVFSSDLRYYLAFEKFFLKNGKPIVDAVVDLLWFRLAGGPLGGNHNLTLNTLKRIGVPVLHGVHLSSLTVEEWEKSRAGIPPVEMVTTVILPELDGRIEPIVTHAPRRKRVNGEVVEEYVAVRDRVEKLARRVYRWVKLRRKKNSEKKVAIIIYNYPPGEENLGKASYLDVFSSLEKLLREMKKRGYTVSKLPSGKWIKDELLKRGAVNSGEWVLTREAAEKMLKVDVNGYSSWLNELPGRVRERVLKDWGPPPGKVMSYGDYLLIPGILLGNVFIGVQPSRGVHEDPSKTYHSRDLSPHHQYIAFYEWIKRVFKADAIIHLGTHGTLEFLPGKDAGLSGGCFPDVLIGDLPNIYVYHVVNPSEAAIARRRSYAVTVSHGTPSLMSGELHGELVELERLLNQYYEAAQYDKAKAEVIAKKALEIAGKYGFEGGIDGIYDRLFEYKRSLIPKGLYVLGEKPSKEDLLNYLVFVARYDRGKVKSLHRIVAEALGVDYDEALERASSISRNGKRYSKVLEEVEAKVKRIIDENLLKGREVKEVLRRLKIEGVDVEEVSLSLSYLGGVMRRVLSSREIESVLNALEGRYIEPGPGGDPVRTPEVYPTGRNMFQLDPTNIPTEVAMERGSCIAEEYIKLYRRKHGRYPRVVSVVLWGFETMKTGGETVAAIFRLLGVKPVWKSIYIRDLEVIPLSELGRPRIDVLVTICGIFRDTFYNLVELLDKAFKLVAELDEPPELNYVRAHYLADKGKFGVNALVRVFGPPEGEYATTVTSLVESGSWRSEADLVNAYIDSMRYGYGDGFRSVKAEEVFRCLMSRVDVVTQVRDTIEYEITDLDHYYEFLGGLTRSVQQVKGEKPVVLVADTTREKVKVEGVGEAIRRGVITRLTNPKWLDEMLKHGFTGASKIADRVEYLLGLAATVGHVEDWMWNLVTERIVFNRDRAEKIKRENPWALRKIVNRLLQAHLRGYWKPPKHVVERLKLVYQELEDYLEGTPWKGRTR